MRDLPVVFIPLLHLRLSSRQVTADEAEASAVELKADTHGALIPRLSPHTGLHGVDGHIPDEWDVVRTYKDVKTDAHQLC